MTGELLTRECSGCGVQVPVDADRCPECDQDLQWWRRKSFGADPYYFWRSTSLAKLDGRPDAQMWLETGEVVQATIVSSSEHGVAVDLVPEVFVPARHLQGIASKLGGGYGRKNVIADLAARVGTGIRLKAIMVDRLGNHRNPTDHLILSERAVLGFPDGPRGKPMAAESVAQLALVQVGEVRLGRVADATSMGFFVDLGKGLTALLHRDELAWEETEDPTGYLELDQEVEVYVLLVDRVKLRVGLSIRRAIDWEPGQP